MNDVPYLLIKTHSGLEEVLADELAEWNIPITEKGLRCVYIPYSPENMYRSNMFLRTALRVLKPVAEFSAEDADDLYRQALLIHWEKFFRQNATFAIDFSGKSDLFTHMKFASLRLKDAVCDRFRHKTGSRPDVDRNNPDVWINLHVNRDKISISVDTGGESLHIRGSRQVQNEAPINEVLAAGLVRLSGWDRKSEFVDGMCGSGTFTSEAMGSAFEIAPCLTRKHYAFTNAPDFESDLFDRLMKEARDRVSYDKNVLFRLNDIKPRAIQKAKQNIQASGLEKYALFSTEDFTRLRPMTDKGVIILNPPYGERMKSDDLKSLYGSVGSTLKHHWPGFRCGIISSDREALNEIGLRPEVNRTVFNGSLECKFRVYSLYAGTKKGRPAE